MLCCVAIVLVAPSASAEHYHWVQYGRDGLDARAITDATTCPSAQIDGVPAVMMVRAAPDDSFPVTACALPLPAGTRSAAIAEVPLALPPAQPRRILVIGDTGCRLKGSYVQACNDPVRWPFRLIAEVAAQRKPDLVIHVGDYHYRETPCPSGDAGCAGSPFGDVWPVWQADFFAPAETLLRIAPWVFVRGNHEECGRGGRGWSRFIAPDAFADGPTSCNGPSQPFVVRLPGLALAIIDVSVAREDTLDTTQVDEFRRQYLGVAGEAGPTWILQHRPIWSPGGVFAGKLVGDNRTLEAAAQDSLPANVTMILSGHHHLFQVLTYRTGQPAQVVVGHGGDYLNQPSSIDPATWTFGPVAVDSGINVAGDFGFAMLEQLDDGWRLTDYDKLGATVRTCTLQGRAAACQ